MAGDAQLKREVELEAEEVLDTKINQKRGEARAKADQERDRLSSGRSRSRGVRREHAHVGARDAWASRTPCVVVGGEQSGGG